MHTDSLSFILRLKMFMKTLEMMLKKDLIHQIMKSKDHCLKEKKIIGSMKYELGRKTMTKFVGLRSKTYSYLIDDGNSDKKVKETNNV